MRAALVTMPPNFSLDPDSVSRRTGWLALAVVAVGLIYLPPWLPAMPEIGLDSYPDVLNYAFRRGWQFGSEFVFTMGPFGFLYRYAYDPATYSLALGMWISFSIVLAAAVILVLVDRQRVGWSIALVVLLLLGLRAGVMTRHFSGQYFQDALFFLVPLLLAAAYCHPGPLPRWLVPVLVVTTAFVGTIKLTFAMPGAAVVALIELHRVSRRQYSMSCLALFLGSSFAFYLLAGQRVASIPDFLVHSLAIASGYSEAMQYWESLPEVVVYVTLAALGFALAAHAEWRNCRTLPCDWRGLVFLGALACHFFVSLKAGFVRHDVHALIAYSGLAVGLAVSAARANALESVRYVRMGLLLLCVGAVVAGFHVNTRHTQVTAAGLVWDNFVAGSWKRVHAIGAMIFGDRASTLRHGYAQVLEGMRRANPLPPLEGAVDIIPWDGTLAIAYGFDYRPRPVYQNYVAYKPSLVELNREHVRSPGAAPNILFRVDPIDNHFPSLDDGLLLLDLLGGYDLGGTAADVLLLRKRESPRPMRSRQSGSVVAGWGSPIPVPMPGRGEFLVARVLIEKTPAGRAGNLLFKVSPTWVQVTMSDGSERFYTLVPNMARSGFILSPIIDSTAKFGQLLRGMGRWATFGAYPLSMRLTRPDSWAGVPITWFYEPEIRVAFETFEIDFGNASSMDQGAVGASVEPATRLLENVASAAAGATATASTTHSGAYTVSAVNDGDRIGAAWGGGGGWNDGSENTFPDWVEIEFKTATLIDHVVLYTLQDAIPARVEPTDAMTFTRWGITAFTLEGKTAGGWEKLATVADNDRVKRTVAFPLTRLSGIRIRVDGALGGYSRIVEIEAGRREGADGAPAVQQRAVGRP